MLGEERKTNAEPLRGRHSEKRKTSVTPNKHENGWWLSLTFYEVIEVQNEPDAPDISIDVGIANFVTTSDGKHYGTFLPTKRRRLIPPLSLVILISDLAFVCWL